MNGADVNCFSIVVGQASVHQALLLMSIIIQQQFTTAGHTQLPGCGFANVGPFGYLSGNLTSDLNEAATAHTGGR
jgi:hypothetical protein